VKAAHALRPPPAGKILVVDDEAALVEAVQARLASEGYEVRVAGDGPGALAAVEADRPDLVILDLMLPGMDGLEVCREIQRRDWVPVLMLTARTEESDKIAGFAVGADDYLTKPFSLRELAARVRAILRRMERAEARAAASACETIRRFDLSIDASRRRVFRNGAEVALTPLEFEILLALAQAPGVVFGREQLMERVWGYRDHAGGRVVDSHVARIRRKLGDDSAEPRYIRTVHWVGYAFCEEPAGAGGRPGPAGPVPGGEAGRAPGPAGSAARGMP
jgi:DNA-binding response OmpR family regulator